MLRYAAWRCVLVDGSKIGKHATVRYADLDEIDLLITDTSASENLLEELRGQVKRLHVVKSDRPKGGNLD